MVFQTAFNFKSGLDCPPTNPGHFIAYQYEESFDADGQPCLKRSGEIDLREIHELGRDLCDLKQMIVRYQRGDLNALNVRDGFYADVVDFPSTPMEVSKLALEAQNIFMRQSAADRALYGNSVNRWLEAVMRGDDKALASVGITAPVAPVEVSASPAPDAVKEVVE